MRYALAVLTHGDNADVLEATIRSFDRSVTHPPVARYVHQDGPCALPPLSPYPWVCLTAPEQRGFCAATRTLWHMVAGGDDFDYVFWLEHDFEMLRTVDVQAMGLLLDAEPDIAQVALMRGPASSFEREYGGVVEAGRARGQVFQPTRNVMAGNVDYLDHRGFFTTNPSLMTRAFMQENPWPTYGSECEGRFGLDLVARGYRFAYMGEGEPWVEHTGERTGKGY